MMVKDRPARLEASCEASYAMSVERQGFVRILLPDEAVSWLVV